MKERPLAGYALLFVLFFAVEVFFARFSLRAGFFWDDLHLIRVYSNSELRQVWSGTYDTDHIETPGLRPVMTLFNHLRARVFGENVVGHRLFLLGLFALYLTLAVALARLLFGVSYRVGVLAGLLTFLHLDNVTHYAWLTDGVHLAADLFVLCAILSLLQTLRSGRYRWLPLSLVCVCLGLLTREDTVVVVPLLGIFACALWRQRRPMPGARPLPLLLYTASLGAIGAAYWLWRAAVVPGAGLGTVRLASLPWAVMQTVQNLGDVTRLVVWWDRYISLIWLWTIALGIVVAVILFLLPRSIKAQAAWWGAAILASVLPVIVVARTNGLLVPITFWSLLLATVLAYLASRTTLGYVTALALAFLALGGSALGSTTWQMDFSTASIKWVCEDTGTLYVNKVTIPDARRAAVRDRLSGFGVDSADTLIRRLPDIVEQARQARRYGPNAQGAIFIPRFRLLAHAWRYDAPCEGGQGWIFPAP